MRRFAHFIRSLLRLNLSIKSMILSIVFSIEKIDFLGAKKSIFLIFLAQPKKCGKKKNFQFLKIPEKFSQNF